MISKQLYLLASVFATRRDVEHLKELLAHNENKAELFDLICVLWPELDEPAHLRFLFDIEVGEQVSSQELLVNLVRSDDNLIPMVEVDHTMVLKRSEMTKSFVESQLSKLTENDNYKLASFEAKWMRNRIIICNRFDSKHAALYKPLWNVAEKDPAFTRWIHGVIEPLEHVNRRLKLSIGIEDFEAMEPLAVFELILRSEPEFSTTVVSREIIPFMTNNDYYDIFLTRVLSNDYFPLDSYCNIKIFSQLLTEVLHASTGGGYNSKIQSKAAEIIFENSSNVIKVCGSLEVCRLLSTIDDAIQVENYTISVASLKHYAKFIESIYKSYSLKELFSLAQEEASLQLAHFSATVREQIMSKTNDERALELFSLLVGTDESSDSGVFTHLSVTEKSSAFIESALDLGKFDLLDKFLLRFNSVIDEDVLVRYFWHFFNKASNGLKTRPEIRNAERTLQLLEQRTEHDCMKALLEVANELSTYSLNLGKGIPFKPSDILDYASRPLDLISLLLELNPELYKSISSTTEILQKLKLGLQNKNSVTKEESASLLALHIDHSLANMDFNFAMRNTRELLKMSDSSNHWPTIFQVGKFIDPQWPDGEVPLDVLAVQMEILGDLLHVCPVEESEVIVSQWSALELELISRDPVHAQYSEDFMGGSHELLQGNVILNGVSNKFTRLLSGTRR